MADPDKVARPNTGTTTCPNTDNERLTMTDDNTDNTQSAEKTATDNATEATL